MNLPLMLVDKLRDTCDAIAQHEQAIASGSSPSLVASLRSLLKRKARLESELAVCHANGTAAPLPQMQNELDTLRK